MAGQGIEEKDQDSSAVSINRPVLDIIQSLIACERATKRGGIKGNGWRTIVRHFKSVCGLWFGKKIFGAGHAHSVVH